MLKQRLYCTTLCFALIGFTALLAGCATGWTGTRITRADQHVRNEEGRYPYRENADDILHEMDLRRGDVAVDIGAGDGWWSALIAERVGKTGAVYAVEIKEELVKQMKIDHAALPQLKPRLSGTDGTGLEENSCDLAFISQVYHHLDSDGQVDYLRHLHDVVRPTGRLMVIERYINIVTKKDGHGTRFGQLINQAEEAGWVLLRYELMPGTYHYRSIFAQTELFPTEPSRRRSAAATPAR